MTTSSTEMGIFRSLVSVTNLTYHFLMTVLKGARNFAASDY